MLFYCVFFELPLTKYRVGRHLVPHNVGNIMFGCYFLNMVFVIFSILRQIQNGTSFRNMNSGTATAGTASKIQYLNIIQIFKISKKHCEKRPTCFQTLTFGRNLGFQKSWICPWISKDFPPHGFPTPWILDFRGGRGSGRQKPRLDAKAESPGCLKAAG